MTKHTADFGPKQAHKVGLVLNKEFLGFKTKIITRQTKHSKARQGQSRLGLVVQKAGALSFAILTLVHCDEHLTILGSD